MNVGQFRREYLEKWLHELAMLGYDTIIWEVENNVQWETCPECVSPDAFTKDEFRSLLTLCRSLGFNFIPLFQTLGHCEYVLKHKPYQHLAELPGTITQYCPLHPELPEFLCRWIDEYIDLFGKTDYFHIGADEAWNLGQCPTCAQFVKDHSLAELYAQHVNKILDHVRQKGVRPIIWADMLLSHPQTLDLVDRDVVMADWMYDIYRGNGKVWVWGKGLSAKEELTEETLAVFGQHLFPNGDEPGKEPETFYTADFLSDRGYQVITCPGSSSYGDNVFAPRNYYHMKNTYDSTKKGLSRHLLGSVLTSWTIHLFPWELQRTSICMPPFVSQNPQAELTAYENEFLMSHFGTTDYDFFRICGLLSKSFLFSYNGSLGFDKSTMPADRRHAEKTIQDILQQGSHYEELKNCLDRLAEFQQALKLLHEYTNKAQCGHEYLAFWKLAARNLINRAMASAYLLAHAIQNAYGECETDLTGVDSPAEILGCLRELRQETALLYRSIIKPTRLNEFMHWIYDSVEYALKNTISGKNSEIAK
jgi:hypothetical protein